jgi:putative glutamine amidotransferase
MQPTIGITTFTALHENYEHPPGYETGQPYVRAVVAAGGVPWLIPLLDDDERTLRAIYHRLDGIVLPGGSDVDPSCYGEDRGALTGRSDMPRDSTELKLARWALEDDKPLIAIC